MAESEPQEGVGSPDGFQRLWTPHRMSYIKRNHDDPGCPFCEISTMPDAEALVVARGEHVYAVLNLYPYNPGHLMVVPYRHIADYTELSDEEAAETHRFVRTAITALREVSGAQAFNIGTNLGLVAGAGIAAHLHQHVVPRWGGDTNFMPIVGHTRVLPQLLADTRDALAAAWPPEL
jgi:ATP adenylyltransferase